MSSGKMLFREPARPKLAIALGGGGALGGIYEMGALWAMEEAIDGINLNDLDIYVGVNAGSFVAANLANQMTAAQMCRIFVRNEADVHPFHPEVFYRPALKEYVRRGKHVPKLVLEACRNFIKNPSDQSLLEAATVLSQVVPSGLFDNEGFHRYLARSYSSIGRTNEFKQLAKPLIIVASQLESGQTVRFGDAGMQDIPISKAVQASMASPGIYVPVEIEGKHYMDGTLRKAMHASIAYEMDAQTVIAINPVVPVNVNEAVANGSLANESMTQSGMPNVISQSYRTMVHSRLSVGMKAVARQFPNRGMLLFEPTREDARFFTANVFSFKARREVCEYAYHETRRSIRDRIGEINTTLEPFEAQVNMGVIEDETRTLTTGLYGAGAAESKPSFLSALLKGQVRVFA